MLFSLTVPLLFYFLFYPSRAAFLTTSDGCLIHEPETIGLLVSAPLDTAFDGYVQLNPATPPNSTHFPLLLNYHAFVAIANILTFPTNKTATPVKGPNCAVVLYSSPGYFFLDPNGEAVSRSQGTITAKNVDSGRNSTIPFVDVGPDAKIEEGVYFSELIMPFTCQDGGNGMQRFMVSVVGKDAVAADLRLDQIGMVWGC
ncbi:hypothetical protein BJ508DRAFT_314337 [Ascobolus immersus RN42]|uniref:Ubiquitin 3 binding protein But2 C-terminal domain-containing protein n=1 Tax=Ascobolus immersus RN42 TaxID=1160509 RepID=A0A3N4HM01_ASCIM|nr:hypothetical protein BJ508DRAFT_314337 [Ascobolus immersus RN42]